MLFTTVRLLAEMLKEFKKNRGPIDLTPRLTEVGRPLRRGSSLDLTFFRLKIVV